MDINERNELMRKLLREGKVAVTYSGFEELVGEIKYTENHIDFNIEIRGNKVTLFLV